MTLPELERREHTAARADLNGMADMDRPDPSDLAPATVPEQIARERWWREHPEVVVDPEDFRA